MIFLAAIMIIAGVALFVAAPLAAGMYSVPRSGGADPELERLEHQRAFAVQGLRELEFDREMGKLSDADYETLRAGLENRALDAMGAIEKLRAESQKSAAARVAPLHIQPPVRPESAAPAAPARAPIAPGSSKDVFCPQCGMRMARNANFCGGCGAGLRPAGRATGWSD
ncbi:MAG TPA: c-type cytochrome biogenesis protein CcmI [Acidimicrobiales bacterium]|nr:c-type cytochrome biogenesis protein CcmI [Acidimicrobiales bacterium]HYB89733.1 c-type cytochrome biogenesis protein CcmI [Candidatus Binataceae bacterium]